ncbi:MAG: beta-ketoacyl-ACP synthase II [Candidatus Limnocylindria bacterium]
MAEGAARGNERRVVVTGIGALTPLGNDVATTWDGLVAGRSGIDRIAAFDPSRLTSQVAGEVKGFDPLTVMDRKEVRRNDRYVHLVWAATLEALRDARLPERFEDEELADRTGAIIGSGIGGINTLVRDVTEAVERGPNAIGPFLVTMLIVDMAPGFVAIQTGARGPNYSTVSACSSSNHALGDALNTIRRGDADVMIAGGAEAGIGEIPVAAFAAMRALSTKRNHEPQRASRPFDADRDGFVIGEGAGILILEEREHARARGARIHAEFVGYGSTDDASHITLPAPGGRGAAESMRLAMRDAGIGPSDVDYINAHGTSTPPNDRSETEAIKAAFGEDAYRVPISSTKSMTGHLLGAGGGVEAIASVMAIREGCIPPTINLDNADPDCDLDYVPNEARAARVDTVMSNAFGFGGHNTTVIFRRHDK